MQQNVQDQYVGGMPNQQGVPGQQPVGYGQYNPQGGYQQPGMYMAQQQPYVGPQGYQQQPGYVQGYGGYQQAYQDNGYAQPYPQVYNQQAAAAAGAGRGFVGGWGNQTDEIPPEKLLSGDLDVKIRNGFVRKVYGILSVQLLITFGMATVFNVYRAAAVWLYQNPWVLIVAMLTMCASVCTMSCVPKTARKFPLNYLMMGIIAVSMGAVLGYSTGAVDTIAFALAAGITAAVTCAVTLFACQTKWDFTGCGIYAFVGLILLMIFGITAGFFHNQIVHIVYASLGAALFSFYLIMDTQKIVGGKHRAYQFSIDDYCFAALTLYMDIINLFIHILSIVAATRDN